MENVGFYLEIFDIIMIITLTHLMEFFFGLSCLVLGKSNSYFSSMGIDSQSNYCNLRKIYLFLKIVTSLRSRCLQTGTSASSRQYGLMLHAWVLQLHEYSS